jgi:hypothetical protein
MCSGIILAWDATIMMIIPLSSVLLLLLILIASLRVLHLVLKNGILHSYIDLFFLRLLGFVVHKLIVYLFLMSSLQNLPQFPSLKPLVGHILVFTLVGHILTLIDRSAGAPHLRIMKITPNYRLVRTLGLFHTDGLTLASPIFWQMF